MADVRSPLPATPGPLLVRRQAGNDSAQVLDRWQGVPSPGGEEVKEPCEGRVTAQAAVLVDAGDCYLVALSR